MTKDELKEALKESFDEIRAEFGEAIDALKAEVATKAEKPAEPTDDEKTAQELEESQADDAVKAAITQIAEKFDELSEGQDKIADALSKGFDRIENLEKHASGRTSLSGQDGGADEEEIEKRNSLAGAIGTALATPGQKVTLVG